MNNWNCWQLNISLFILCFFKLIEIIFKSKFVKHRNDTEYLNQQNEEQSIRLSKYEQRLNENEEQNDRHLHLEERMKERLKEMTLQFEELNEKVKQNIF
jgi:hypothetical protein